MMKIDPATREAKGQRTPIETLFRRAEIEPQKHFGSFPLTDNIDDGFRHFTFADLARAVDVCAWHLKETYGTSKIAEPILYMGANDFRYTFIFYAAIKCGFKMLFINPRYPIEGVLAVVDKIECKRAFHSPEELAVIQNIQSHRPGFQASEVPAQSSWLDAEPRPFPYSKTYEDDKYEEILAMHSSGTTGLPKPIVFKHGYFGAFDISWADEKGVEISTAPLDIMDGCNLCFSVFPQCHMGGLITTNIRGVFSTAATVLGPATADYTRMAPFVLKLLQTQPIDLLAATPLLLEGLIQLPGGYEALKKLKVVFYAGGPLRAEIARKLLAHDITLINDYGSTEMAMMPGFVPDKEDFEWFKFNPGYKMIFEPVGDEAGSYEFVIRKGEGPEEEKLHLKRGIHWTLGLDEYRSKDLFIPHPTKPDLWKYYGRTDDILVLAHAGKMNPIPIEDTIGDHPGVAGVLVTGEHRWPPCVLVEPKEKVPDHKKFIEEIWPQIEKANDKLRKEMRIPKELVAILEEKGLARGIKAQVVRKTNVQKHADVIEKLYRESEVARNGFIDA